MHGGPDVDLHNLDDDGVEDPDKHADDGVDKPVDQDVARQTDAETAANKSFTY